MAVAGAACAALMAVAGCNISGGAPSSSPSAQAHTDGSTIHETVTATLTSSFSELHTVGPDNSRVFGWNLLTGPGTLFGQPVDVRLQGSVEYTGGNGPFDGFLRLVAADGSEISLYVDGQATRQPADEGGATEFYGRMNFIGASGSFAGYVAAGDFTGTRAAELGAPVQASLDLYVDPQQR